MIEIQSLRDFSKEDIIKLLKSQDEQPFKIYVPKETQLYNSESNAISEDYAHLAYTGHLLAEAAENFDFHEVKPDEFESVLFEIETPDIPRLADALLLISYGYVSDHPDDPEFSFPELVSQYFYELEEGIISDAACPYFVETALEFMEIDEEDEFEEDEEDELEEDEEED